MDSSKTIAPDSLMTREACAKIRYSAKAEVITQRRLRTVHLSAHLGAHISVQFEDERTIRRQVQEMLHIEKIFDAAGIRSEIEACAALPPSRSEWKATMLIESPAAHERKREPARLIGVEDRMFVEVEGHCRSDAIADEDLDRENAAQTSAVHLVRFEFTKAARDAVRAGAGGKLGCDHPNYPAHGVALPETLANLAGDLI